MGDICNCTDYKLLRGVRAFRDRRALYPIKSFPKESSYGLGMHKLNSKMIIFNLEWYRFKLYLKLNIHYG
jgi:hypothetical protein